MWFSLRVELCSLVWAPRWCAKSFSPCPVLIGKSRCWYWKVRIQVFTFDDPLGFRLTKEVESEGLEFLVRPSNSRLAIVWQEQFPNLNYVIRKRLGSGNWLWSKSGLLLQVGSFYLNILAEVQWSFVGYGVNSHTLSHGQQGSLQWLLRGVCWLFRICLLKRII